VSGVESLRAVENEGRKAVRCHKLAHEMGVINGRKDSANNLGKAHANIAFLAAHNTVAGIGGRQKENIQLESRTAAC